MATRRKTPPRSDAPSSHVVDTAWAARHGERVCERPDKNRQTEANTYDSGPVANRPQVARPISDTTPARPPAVGIQPGRRAIA